LHIYVRTVAISFRSSIKDEVLERIAHALEIDPTELFSKSCYPVEAVRSLHHSILEGFDQVLKAQIAEFEAKYRE